MPIPKYSQLLRPLLALAAKQDLTRRGGTEAMSRQFDLTEEECALRIPSGTSTYIRNRTGWAMTFLTKGALIEKVPKHLFLCFQLNLPKNLTKILPPGKTKYKTLGGVLQQWEF